MLYNTQTLKKTILFLLFLKLIEKQYGILDVFINSIVDTALIYRPTIASSNPARLEKHKQNGKFHLPDENESKQI